MRKLRLEIDELAVESFDTGGDERLAGTVHGHVTYAVGCQTAPDQTCGNFLTCAYKACGTPTAGESCWDGTCDLACTGSCGATHCAGDCTHGQTNGDTCACGTAITCSPDATCTLSCEFNC